MDETRLKELLRRVAGGSVSVTEALERLKIFPFEDVGFAKIDHHRTLRRGFPEVIFCEGKAPDQIAAIARGIMEQGGNVLATRCPRRATTRRVRSSRLSSGRSNEPAS
jgi:NCAIR mutase (PurE)-related protein